MRRRGTKSAAQTPAPKSDRIKGSKVNPKGSAASQKSASKIVLSEKTMTALKNKLAEFKKTSSKNITLNDLKAVYRRGSGAYSSSHRPGIPRNAWAMARVNKFLKKAKGEKVKAAYVQDDDLLANGGNIKIYADGGLLAPNGRKSNLTPEQYKLVRTPKFKAWFGDWENDFENASKVVDENGEPLVVYHGAEIFNKKGKGRFNIFKRGSYFTDTYDSAKYYAFKIAFGIDDVKEEDTEIYEVFLNIRNPKTFDYKNDDAEYYFHDFNENDERIIEYEKQNFDGIIWEYDFKMYSVKIGGLEKEKHYITFNPEQIKLADGTNTTFDGSNPDIRYKNGGEIDSFYLWFNNWYKSVYNQIEITITLPNEITGLKSVPDTEDNIVILDMFRKKDLSIDAKTYLQKILDKADEFGITIYLIADPNHRYIDDVQYKKKITRKYLIDYYKKFGFELTPDKEFMKRAPKKYADGGELDEIVYHGSPNKFEKFELEKVGTTTGRLTGGYGIYFTNKEEVAKEYVLKGGSYIKAKLKSNNFFDLDDNITIVEEILKQVEQDERFTENDVNNLKSDYLGMSDYGYEVETNRKLHEWLSDTLDEKEVSKFIENLGYDGTTFIDRWNREARNYVIFNPDNIEIVDIENFGKGGKLNEKIQLPDVQASEESLKRVLEMQGYKLEKIKAMKEGGIFSDVISPEEKDLYMMKKFQQMSEGGNVDDDDDDVDVTCVNCGWGWNTSQSDKSDKYVCHNCGFDNTLFYEKMFKKPQNLNEIAEKHSMPVDLLEEELKKGIEHEMEHTNDVNVAKTIALHHIAETPNYYEKLEAAKLEEGGEMAKGGMIKLELGKTGNLNDDIIIIEKFEKQFIGKDLDVQVIGVKDAFRVKITNAKLDTFGATTFLTLTIDNKGEEQIPRSKFNDLIDGKVIMMDDFFSQKEPYAIQLVYDDAEEKPKEAKSYKYSWEMAKGGMVSPVAIKDMVRIYDEFEDEFPAPYGIVKGLSSLDEDATYELEMFENKDYEKYEINSFDFPTRDKFFKIGDTVSVKFGSLLDENESFLTEIVPENQTYKVIEFADYPHSRSLVYLESEDGKFYYVEGAMVIKPREKYEYKEPKKYKYSWEMAKGGMTEMAKGGMIYVFDVVLYEYDDDGGISKIKEKKQYKVKASDRSKAYDKAKSKYPKPYFVELNTTENYSNGGKIKDEAKYYINGYIDNIFDYMLTGKFDWEDGMEYIEYDNVEELHNHYPGAFAVVDDEYGDAIFVYFYAPDLSSSEEEFKGMAKSYKQFNENLKKFQNLNRGYGNAQEHFTNIKIIDYKAHGISGDTLKIRFARKNPLQKPKSEVKKERNYKYSWEMAEGGDVLRKVKRKGEDPRWGYFYVVGQSGDNLVVVIDEKINHWNEASPAERHYYYEDLIPSSDVEYIDDQQVMADGGVVVGKRHSESDENGTGEKFMVKSTGQVVELEGGEGVLCRQSMTSNKKYEFLGKEMSGRQIASFLNHKYGGVEFAKGGDIPKKVCGCRAYYHGGEVPSATLNSLEGGEAVVTVKTMESKNKYEFQGVKMTPREILSKINTDGGGKKFEEGGVIDLSQIKLDNEIRMVKMLHFCQNILYNQEI